MDATADGIPLLRVGVVRVGVKVGITVVDIAPRTVKQEPPSAPPRRSSGALVIRKGARTSSPPLRSRKRKPRKDNAAAAASDLADTEAARAEDAVLREAIAKSLADLVPADNSMPMDAVLAWSR
jgi:hypothetical protein